MVIENDIWSVGDSNPSGIIFLMDIISGIAPADFLTVYIYMIVNLSIDTAFNYSILNCIIREINLCTL